MAKMSESIVTVRDLLAVSYGNLAMSHHCVENGNEEYTRTGYMIRAKLVKGLRTGSMNIGSMLDDEKLKYSRDRRCSYCNADRSLSLDHVIPTSRMPLDSSDNLVLACRSCNSSKGKKDLLVWYQDRAVFPLLMVLRRYLKLTALLAEEMGVLDSPVDSEEAARLPVSLESIPVKNFPLPKNLQL